MAVDKEKQAALNGVVESLGIAKFRLTDNETVSVAAVLADRTRYTLLDTRTAEERAVSVIPGAITREQFEASPTTYASTTVVCYCTVGYLSGACTRELRNKGHGNVVNMGDGALLGYTLAQTSNGVAQPLAAPDGTPTNEVHTFMDDLAPLAGSGMVAHTFPNPQAVLEAANQKISSTLDLS